MKYILKHVSYILVVVVVIVHQHTHTHTHTRKMSAASLRMIEADSLQIRAYHIGDRYAVDVDKMAVASAEHDVEVARWPQRSALKCVNDAHFFSTAPFPVVVYRRQARAIGEPDDAADVFECIDGPVACSCECALAWMKRNPSLTDLDTALTIEFAKILAPDVYARCGLIRAAPPPELYLVEYGGEYDVHQYRTMFCNGNPLQRTVRLFPPNCTKQPLRWIEAYRASLPCKHPSCFVLAVPNETVSLEERDAYCRGLLARWVGGETTMRPRTYDIVDMTNMLDELSRNNPAFEIITQVAGINVVACALEKRTRTASRDLKIKYDQRTENMHVVDVNDMSVQESCAVVVRGVDDPVTLASALSSFRPVVLICVPSPLTKQAADDLRNDFVGVVEVGTANPHAVRQVIVVTLSSLTSTTQNTEDKALLQMVGANDDEDALLALHLHVFSQ